MRKFILLFCLTAFLISCGSSRKATTSRKETPSARKSEVKKEVVRVNESKKETKKPLATAPYKERVQNYIYEYASIAKNEMTSYGIPASITLAQGILESGAGYGELTGKANNHFGIKCHDWTGEKVYHDDDRSQECFRKYDKASQSFRDHSLFLKNRKRYAKLFTYKQDDYKSWAYGLRAAGYATDKKYPAKLISIIERYQLDAFDDEVLGKRPLAEKPTKPIKSVSKPVKEVSRIATPSVPVSRNSDEYIVQKGDTLYSISRKLNLKVSELKAFNKLKDNNIGIGQILKIAPYDEDDEF
ncbi:glucosaminidase domain-containing protein [Aquimarina sp. RZ0]|uniref:glucosaminidase domain-containing protein n=1 Tax=Aquimarina sp. RZ0 TaxID=2607730 RepID=UPI0011F1D84F|nr:glucosaminidase domain-containing protein [Aquimarina sp. RZ0]KAA1242123.1 LysM peptidoglycan-binding domain-containing protein [Aquimarina sp. RZ0]